MNGRTGPRRLALGAATTFAVVAVYLLLAAAGDRAHRSPFRPAAAPGPTAASERPVTTGPRPVRPAVEHDLATVLISDAGQGFQAADPGRFPQGPLDAAAAARLEPNPTAERARLAARGFQRGYQRAWTTAAGDVIGAVVYQFGDEAGAEGYLADGTSIVLAQGAEEFTVPLEGGRGFSQLDDAMTVHTVAFARRGYFFLFFGASEQAALSADRVVAVATAQAGYLAGPR